MSIHDILSKIQIELKVPKSQFNSFGKYNYRSAEDILESAKPICSKHGATLTLSDEAVNIGERYYIKATATLSVADIKIETTAFAREDSEKKGMDGSQISGTASSYARKYALNGLFCIDDTKDTDTDEHSNQCKEAAKKDAAAWDAVNKSLMDYAKSIGVLPKTVQDAFFQKHNKQYFTATAEELRQTKKEMEKKHAEKQKKQGV